MYRRRSPHSRLGQINRIQLDKSDPPDDGDQVQQETRQLARQIANQSNTDTIRKLEKSIVMQFTFMERLQNDSSMRSNLLFKDLECSGGIDQVFLPSGGQAGVLARRFANE
jgi:hypothetical protein